MFTEMELDALPNMISAPRFSTYLRAANNDRQLALKLYGWNLEISSALYIPLQMFEIGMRNAAVEAFQERYGPNWHTNDKFVSSLPKFGGKNYCPFKDFKKVSFRLSAAASLTSGKLVADLQFAFWDKIFTRRFDDRLWRPYCNKVFPNASRGIEAHQVRKIAMDTLITTRKLRNRIAHHEPIFSRDIDSEYTAIMKLMSWRCSVSVKWIENFQQVTMLLQQKPQLP